MFFSYKCKNYTSKYYLFQMLMSFFYNINNLV